MSLEVSIFKHFSTFELDVDFKAENETFGFLGASGCGKSLTLRCIAGIETPDQGRIVVNDRVFFDSAAGINLTPQERKTALLFQNYMLFPNLTVEQNIAAGIGKELSKEERHAIVAHELERFSLHGFEKRYPLQLSGGQQQRVALARMLAAKPGILMLDEPFSALDAHLKSMLEQNLANLFAEYDGTIVYVSHDIDEALRFCNRIAVVDAGKIVEIDTADEIVDHPQSLAALKLSGCKNITAAEWRGEHRVFLPRWNIELDVQTEVPRDVRYVGFRAFSVRRGVPGEANFFECRVDRVSDARFERMALLSFSGSDKQESTLGYESAESRYLDQHVFWKLAKTRGMSADEDARSDAGEAAGAFDVAEKNSDSGDNLPDTGDRVGIVIPAGRIYLVTR